MRKTRKYTETKNFMIPSGSIFQIHCQEPWFSKIRAGIKAVEGRKFNPKYLTLKHGDLLEFYWATKVF